MPWLGRLDDPIDERSDDELVAAARNGSVAAFEVLVRRHQAFVTATAMRVVRNRTTAEDLAQEALFRAWRRLGDFRGDAQFRSWVYRIVTNLALNHVERSRELPHDELPENMRPSTTEGQVMEQAIEDQWSREIAELPEELRAPYVMRERQGLAYEDIATELGIPLNTVRTRIHRARKRVGESMKDWR